MITEFLDTTTGAILFKPDEESKTLEALQKTVKTLEKRISTLENRIKELEAEESK